MNRRGFTLLELLVAASLGAMLAVVATGAARVLVASSVRSAESQLVDATAYRALDGLTRDLESILCPSGDGAWLVVSLPGESNDTGIWESSSLQKPAAESLRLDGPLEFRRFGLAGAWLRFFTFGSDSSDPQVPGPGKPTAVSYRILRRGDPRRPGSPAAYLLQRSDVRATAAGGRPGILESGYDLAPGAATAYMEPGTGNDGTVPGDPYSVNRPGHAVAIPAANVIDFGVRILSESHDGTIEELFPTTDPSTVCELRGDAVVRRILVDIFIRVLTEEGAARTGLIESERTRTPRPPQFASDAAWWWAIAEAHSRTYVRRITLNGGSR